MKYQKKIDFEEDTQEQNLLFYPEWSESELVGEKWASKHAFEDPEGQPMLPRHYRRFMDSTKRVSEVIGDSTTTVIVNSSTVIDEIFTSDSIILPSFHKIYNDSKSVTDATKRSYSDQTQPTSFPSSPQSKMRSELIPENDIPRKSTVTFNETDANLTGTSKLFQSNQHLLNSNFFISILSCCHFLYWNAKTKGVSGFDDSYPWENIYPKAKDGTPMYNPSGKYVVKLHWLGTWRKITIDDKIPVDSQGRALMLTSSLSNEIWPFLLCKALLKVANTSFIDDGEYDNYGDFDVLTALRGWAPEKINLQLNNQFQILQQFWGYKQGQNSNKEKQRRNSELSKNKKGPELTKDQTKMNLDSLNPIILLVREKSPEEKLDVNQLPVFYKVIEFQNKIIQLKPFFSIGCKTDEQVDIWINMEDLHLFFLQIIVYHPLSTFKTIKSWSNIVDPAKPIENYRYPNILYFPSDFNYEGDGILIFISTFGKNRHSFHNGIPSLTIDEYSFEVTPCKSNPVKISCNGVQTVLFYPKRDQVYTFDFNPFHSVSINVLSKYDDFWLEDEAKYLVDQKGMKMREFEECSAAQQHPNSWNILFKHVMMVTEPTFVYCTLLLPDQMALYTSVKVINNDTDEELSQVNFIVSPQIYPETKSGYTFVAENKSPFARPSQKWKFRIYSNEIPPNLIEKEYLFTKMNIQDFSEDFVPNKHFILYRSLVKVKEGSILTSIQTLFSIPSVWIKMTLFHNDIEMCSVKGKGQATITNVMLHVSDEPQASKQAKDDKKGVQLQTSTSQRHKYILQATISPTEFAKLSNLVASGARLTTRLGKVQSAGKRKKVSTIAATSPMKDGFKGGKPIGDGAVPENNILNISSYGSIQSINYNIDLDMSCDIRFISAENSSIIFVKDTEKEDRYKQIKDSWEAANPGRLAKARELREVFVRAIENNAIIPPIIDPELNIKLWTITKDRHPIARVFFDKKLNEGSDFKPPTSQTARDAIEEQYTYTGHAKIISSIESDIHQILDASDFEKRTEQRLAKTQNASNSHKILVEQRSAMKELRAIERKKFIEIVEWKTREVEAWQKWDSERKEEYKISCLESGELVDLAKLAEQEAVEDNMDKKKKAAKK